MTKLRVLLGLVAFVGALLVVLHVTRERREARDDREPPAVESQGDGPELSASAKTASASAGSDTAGRPPPATPTDATTSATPNAQLIDGANWAPHVPFLAKWGALVTQPNGERVALKDPSVFRGMSEMVATIVEAQPGVQMSDLQGLLKDATVQARQLDAAAAACPTPRSESSAAWIRRAIAELQALRADGYGHAYGPLHSARREVYMAAEASIPVACRADFGDAVKAILFGSSGDIVPPESVTSTLDNAGGFMLQAWTEMYGVRFPIPEGLPRGAKPPFLELFEEWWKEGGQTQSRLVRDHGEVMSLVLNDRSRAWKEHGNAATMAILDLRVAMAELQDRYEALLLPLLDSAARAKVEQGRPNTLFIAGRL